MWQLRYESLYAQQVNALKRQGKSKSTLDVYARAVRRVAAFFDRCPDTLDVDDLKTFFSSRVDPHSWRTVKVNRNGLPFFYQPVLDKKWGWVDIVKPLPDILTPEEIARLINSTQPAHYQTCILTVYSRGPGPGEALNLKVGDIDSQLMRVHLRQAKGKKDRYVTLQALRQYGATHRPPPLIFPAGKNAAERRQANVHRDRGGVQKSFQVIVRHSNGEGPRMPENNRALHPAY